MDGGQPSRHDIYSSHFHPPDFHYLPPVSLTSVANLPPGWQIATGVVDTGGKFAAVVVDTGGKFATGIKNTSQTGGKICRRCSWHRWQICRRCRWYRWCTFTCEYLREFSKTSKTVLMGYSGAGGKLIHEKNQKQKISWHCPFKPNPHARWSSGTVFISLAFPLSNDL